jgi:GNAT superfamily N-acetyltransferase
MTQKIEVRAASLEERTRICRLVNLAYDAESYGPSLADPCRSVGSSHIDPYDRPENTRILLANDEIVSVAHVVEREAYVFGDRAPFGIITSVATHPGHRRRGYTKRVMEDAERHMRGKGMCYGWLMGAHRVYGGSLGWRMIIEKDPVLGTAYIVSAAEERDDGGLNVRPATPEDVPFLHQTHAERYRNTFGPVVRSRNYWRHWSLQCTWEGVYRIVSDDSGPVGYYHATDNSDVDEVGWKRGEEHLCENVLRALVSAEADKGNDTVDFFFPMQDEPVVARLYSIFKKVRKKAVGPLGQFSDDWDVKPYLPENWPDATGHMVKWLSKGPGILSSVETTDDLLDVMGRHGWWWMDGDTM